MPSASCHLVTITNNTWPLEVGLPYLTHTGPCHLTYLCMQVGTVCTHWSMTEPLRNSPAAMCFFQVGQSQLLPLSPLVLSFFL
jgi:hypothetical protein